MKCDGDCQHCQLPVSKCHGGGYETPYIKGNRPRDPDGIKDAIEPKLNIPVDTGLNKRRRKEWGES